jgi:hypothetical protein
LSSGAEIIFIRSKRHPGGFAPRVAIIYVIAATLHRALTVLEWFKTQNCGDRVMFTIHTLLWAGRIILRL